MDLIECFESELIRCAGGLAPPFSSQRARKSYQDDLREVFASHSYSEAKELVLSAVKNVGGENVDPYRAALDLFDAVSKSAVKDYLTRDTISGLTYYMTEIVYNELRGHDSDRSNHYHAIVFAKAFLDLLGSMEPEYRRIFKPYITNAAELAFQDMGNIKAKKGIIPRELTDFAIQLTNAADRLFYPSSSKGYHDIFNGYLQ